MRLQEVVTLRAALGASDVTDINNALASALDSASVALEHEIRTPFASVVGQEDRFFQRNTVFFSNQPQNHFLLKRGFLTANPTAVVYADSWEHMEDAVVTDITAECTYDLEKGIVHCYQHDLTGKFVSVTYSAGFTADANEKNQYDLSLVPDWLQVAAGLMAKISVQNHPFFHDGETETDSKALKSQLVAMILNHVRYVPVANTPIN